MTKLKELRVNAMLSVAVACVGAALFVLDLYLLLIRHATGERRVRDIAFLFVYGLGSYVWRERYRQLSAQIARHNASAQSD